jgi:hypothetical protein
MNEKQIEELADELSRQLGEDIRSGVSFSTQGTPNPGITEEDIEKIKQSLEPKPFTLAWRMYFGIDWGSKGDETRYYFPES